VPASLGGECSHGFNLDHDPVDVVNQPVEDATERKADSPAHLKRLASTRAPGRLRRRDLRRSLPAGTLAMDCNSPPISTVRGQVGKLRVPNEDACERTSTSHGRQFETDTCFVDNCIAAHCLEMSGRPDRVLADGVLKERRARGYGRGA